MKTVRISVEIRDKRNPMARELSSSLYRPRLVENKKIKANKTRSKGSLRRQLIAADHLLSGSGIPGMDHLILREANNRIDMS